MRVQLKLYGSSKLLDTKEILNIELPENSKIKKLRNVLINLWKKIRKWFKEST